jgi:hypothetical protein
MASAALRATVERMRPDPRSLPIPVAARANIDFEPGPLDDTEDTIANPPTVSNAEMTKNLETVLAASDLSNCGLQE